MIQNYSFGWSLQVRLRFDKQHSIFQFLELGNNIIFNKFVDFVNSLFDLDKELISISSQNVVCSPRIFDEFGYDSNPPIQSAVGKLVYSFEVNIDNVVHLISYTSQCTNYSLAQISSEAYKEQRLDVEKFFSNLLVFGLYVFNPVLDVGFYLQSFLLRLVQFS